LRALPRRRPPAEPVRRLLVISHPAVLAVNQLPYAELRRHAWDPFIVAPARWRNDYSAAVFGPEVLPELRGHVVGRRVLLPGRIQRYVYLTRPARLLRSLRPDAAFLEAEPTSASAAQWSRSLARAGIPFGLQCDENLDRRWPLPARIFRRQTLGCAAFVAARSPAAAALVHKLRPGLPAPVIPHHVPPWAPVGRSEHASFVIGFAGRLVPEKGLEVLIDAVSEIDGALIRLVGNGPMEPRLRDLAASAGVALEIDTTVEHEQMPAAYAAFDVLVLPSLTRPTWAEQFGRVLVEALWCGVPVVGSDSGEIPWVIKATGGGLVVPEGDVGALREALMRLRESPALRSELARRGCERVREQFSVQAVARELDLSLRRASGLEEPQEDPP
jgi:glycosyltransferase involved in cell wall biosynthesis